jgi:8-oxo-dGTP pyrophosphatase MutT (NUDIX family)
VAIWNNHKIGMKRMSAGGMIFDPSGKTLLIKSRLRGTWEWPAGRSEGNESPLQTCRREVCEESGLDIADFRFLGVNFQTGGMTKNGRLNFTFVAEVSAEIIVG